MTGIVMIGLVPLIADIGDFIGILVFIVIGVLSVIGQIMNKAKEGRQNAGPARKPPPRPGQQQGPLANKLEEFIRQVAQGPVEGGRRQAAPGQSAAAQPLVEAVPVADESGNVAEHVRTRGASRNISTLGSRSLDSQVAQADENLEEHVHDVFDHQLGRLGDTPGETAKKSGAAIPPTAAAGLAAMLANPGRIRQAIVLSEILQRPEHRWS